MNTVREALTFCGIPDGPPLFNNQTQAERMAEGLFSDSFEECMDKSLKQLSEDFAAFSDLPVNAGRIRLVPTVPKKVRAFMQWTRDMIRTGKDPASEPFPVARTTELIRRLTTHEQFMKAASTFEASKPQKLKADTKWPDWKPTLMTYLRNLPGRDGIPLSYVIRPNDLPDPTPRNDFLEEYVYASIHQGDAYRMDNMRVAGYIQDLVLGNVQAETRIQSLTDPTDGRAMFKSLDDYYSGVGVFAIEMTQAENTIRNITYTGEKQPHMWWDEFERRLTHAYAIVDKREGRQVHSNEMKLRTLCNKLRAEFLTAQLASINTELAKQPMTYTFEQALAAVRNVVAQKHRDTPNHARNAGARHVRQTNTRRNNNNNSNPSNRPQHGGRGRGGNGGQSNNTPQRIYNSRNEVPQSRTDSEAQRLRNGKWIDYHPSYFYPAEVMREFPDDLRSRLKSQRDEYKRTRGQNTSNTSRQIQELQAELQTLRTQMSSNASLPSLPPVVNIDTQSRVSQMTMGGRNEQHNQRTPRYNESGQRISPVHVHTTRISSTTLQPQFQSPAHTTADNETDNNADTTVMGANFALINHSTRVADVYAFDTTLGPTTVPISTGATAYDHPDGYVILLYVHEALWYGSRLNHSLWNPNQLRAYGIPFWDNPFDTTHDLSIDLSDDVKIPLQTKGTKVYFSTRVPTANELADPDIQRFDVTSSHPWNPASVHLSVNQIHIDPDLLDRPARRTFVSTERHHSATAETLAEHLGIGIVRAQQTLAATLQRGTRSAILPLERRYRADRHFQTRRLRGNFSTDTAYFPIKSLRGNIASQIYFDKCGFAACYHLPRTDDRHVGPTLTAFSTDYGIPDNLTLDGANVQVGRNTEFQRFIRRNGIKFHVSHPRRPNENPAEGGICEIKRRFYRFIQKYDIPMRLWDFVLDYTIEIMNVTVNSSRYSNKRTPLEIITGITPDISEYLDFHIYDWVFFRANAGLGPRQIGRWLGVSHRRGPLMTYWILTENAQVISCDSVQRVTNAERESDVVKQQMVTYSDSIRPRLQAAAGNIPAIQPNELLFDLENETEEFLMEFNRVIDDPTLPHTVDSNVLPGISIDTEPDPYLHMEVGLRRDPEEYPQRAIVKRRRLDERGMPMGAAHPSGNPMLDQREYEVEFPDGTTQFMFANFLAENILAQVDDEGHRQLLLDEITDHRTNAEAIPKEKGMIQSKNGSMRRVFTTRGWELYVRWKDGSMSWVALKDLKESYPVELAQYARNHSILDEPAFAWWAPHALRKADVIISKIKSKYWERTHKYGIRIPKSIAEAKKIDAENGDTLWMDSVHQEMAAIRVALEEFEGNVRELIGYQLITGHIVFDVKLGENFRRKARYCADGHKTKAPASITYSSVVSRDSVRIMLLIASLNGLSLKAADVQNAFLTAPNLEKVYLTAGPEFGSDAGKTYIVRRALYGLKSASAAFRTYLAEKLEEIGFKSSVADPDVWMRAATAPDGTEYYSYVLAYVDDILAIDCDPDSIMRQIGERFKFKNDEVKEPSSYLGAKLKLRSLNGTSMWTMSSDNYTTAALKNIESTLQKRGWKLPVANGTPLPTDYHPELDATRELDDEERTLYQEFIGMIRWATEIGRVDVLHEVSIMSQFQAIPRLGHLEHLLRIFAYWKQSSRISLYFDPRLPDTDYTFFATSRSDFQAHYRDAKEILPHNMPPPRGCSVTITGYVDASHAANKVTRRSHTGYLIFLNRAPILWYSKRQNTVESSTFSSEFIALRALVEAVTHLRFKLRMFGIPLAAPPPSTEDEEPPVDPAYIFCDNESVVKNSTHVESTLNKKHASLAYHYVRWNVAAGIVSLAWISGKDNPADPLTKILPRATRDHLFRNWVY